MAKPLTPLLLAALLGSGACLAQGDPTRPPSGFSEQPGAVSDRPAEVSLELKGVFLMGARPYALLNGQSVRVGDRLDEGVVVSAIDEQGVWLKTPQGPRQLKLWPQVKKTPSPEAGMEKK